MSCRPRDPLLPPRGKVRVCGTCGKLGGPSSERKLVRRGDAFAGTRDQYRVIDVPMPKGWVYAREKFTCDTCVAKRMEGE